MKGLQKLLRVSLLAWPFFAAQPYAQATEYYVSLSGDDNNPGTSPDAPLRHIVKGIEKLVAGDVLNLRHGVYVEPILIAGKTGPITIRSYRDPVTGSYEEAYIDGSLEAFRKKYNPNSGNLPEWILASTLDRDAHPHEYVSRRVFTENAQRKDDAMNRGAFLDRTPHTRLITYSKLQDLRSENQIFDEIPKQSDLPPESRIGPPSVLEKCKAGIVDPTCIYPLENDPSKLYRATEFSRPWVYMGPGIWFNRDQTSSNYGRIHIRLSSTTNGIPGLADYTTIDPDPNNVSLAIVSKGTTTVDIRKSSNLRFENLTLRYGGEHTVEVQGSTGIVFDHVRIFTGSHGARLGATDGVKFLHTEIDGGVPSWYFRSDRKAEYLFPENGFAVENNLGKQTSRALLYGNDSNTNSEYAYCEFRNGHDLYINGKTVDFHHNWVNNLNDEGVILDAAPGENIHVRQNVVTKVVSGLSFGGEKAGGPRYIYRNLVDVRGRVAGHRPRFKDDKDVWRYGNAFKFGGEEPAIDMFQNTFLVYDQRPQASYLHYQGQSANDGRRRSFNNIFYAFDVYDPDNPQNDSDLPITYLPSPCFPGPTDGNLYRRVGAVKAPLLTFREFKDCQITKDTPKGSIGTLETLRDSPYQIASKAQYEPGYERNSKAEDPQFRRIGPDGVFRETDDLRLGEGSPARAAGIPLPPELQEKDPYRVDRGLPDIGAYRFGSAPLQVGVDARRSFPQGD